MDTRGVIGIPTKPGPLYLIPATLAHHLACAQRECGNTASTGSPAYGKALIRAFDAARYDDDAFRALRREVRAAGKERDDGRGQWLTVTAFLPWGSEREYVVVGWRAVLAIVRRTRADYHPGATVTFVVADRETQRACDAARAYYGVADVHGAWEGEDGNDHS